MIFARKSRANLNKPLKLLLAATLVIGLWPAVVAPQAAKAATVPVGPGGVEGAELWLRPDAGITVASGEKVASWLDQSTQANHATQKDTAHQPTYRNDAANNVNFNPVLDFNGSNSLSLDVTKLPLGNASRSIVSVAETRVSTSNHYIISWGDNASTKMMGMLQIATTGSLTGYTQEFTSASGFWKVGVPNELFGTYDGTTGALYSKMSIIGSGNRTWNTGTTAAAVGSMLGIDQNWNGTIGDLIVYDHVLNDTERQRISSYLSLKYGYTIADNDYLDSTGAKVWNSVTNDVYGYNIGGIARDDASALNQKQSNSTNSDLEVIIGLGSIQEKNSDNTAVFADDLQYLVWGDNGEALDYTVPYGDRAHTERVWKVQNTGSVGQVEIAIPKAALPEKGSLLVGNDAGFSTADEYPLTLKTINGNAYYTTKLTFTDGQYFTLVTTKPELESVSLTQTQSDEGIITLDFDQNIDLTNLDGFSITVDGEELSVTDVTYGVSGNRLTLTLPAGSGVTSDSDVLVEYDQAEGNLIGESTGLGVDSFSKQAINGFAAALSINEPGETIVAQSNPDISGQAAPGSTVDVVIRDKDGHPVAGGPATVDDEGNWIYDALDLDLDNGEYTIEVTATKDDQIAVKTQDLWITDKTALQSKLAEASGRIEEDYTPDSWAALQSELIAAQEVLANTNATPDEVESVLAGLSDALDALVKKSPKLVSVALSDDQVTLTFDQSVEVSDAAGLTVTVGGQTVTLTSANLQVDPSDPHKVIVTLPQNPNGSQVLVSYQQPDESAGSGLQGTNGEPIESFANVEAIDPFVAAFTLEQPAGSKVSSHKPALSGQVEEGSTVEVVIKDKDGNPVEGAGGSATVDEQGNWTFTPPTNLKDGTYTIEVTATNGNRTFTIIKEFTVDTDSAGGSSGSHSSGGTTADDTSTTEPESEESGITTSVNGTDNGFATSTTSTTGGTLAQVDLDKLNEILSQGNGQELEIASAQEGDLTVDGLTAETIQQMAGQGTTLNVSNPLAIYPVPGSQLNLEAVAGQLGDAALDDIAVHIEIALSSDTLIDKAEKKAAAEGYELLVTPVELDLTFSSGGQTVRAEQLNGFAPKYIALPEGIDPNRITTGVVVNSDGSVFHVPTVVTKIDNRYYALINDLRSNGTYSVIWNPQDFDDVRGHWAQADINNIAARLDLKGTGNNTFSPNRNVTRSEFSEIVVVGLGLMRQDAPQALFSDVPESAWYRDSVAIANEFGIVLGYNDGTFNGGLQITREQGIAMIARAYKLIEPGASLGTAEVNELLASYEDGDSVAAWAREDVALMIDAGIVQGNELEMLNPKANMTRAEVAALIARLLKATDLIDQ